MKKKSLKWYLTESVPAALNSYQISKVIRYLEEMKLHHKVDKNFGMHEPFTCTFCQKDDYYNAALDNLIKHLSED